jgi:type II secretory pathway component PulF
MLVHTKACSFSRRVHPALLQAQARLMQQHTATAKQHPTHIAQLQGLLETCCAVCAMQSDAAASTTAVAAIATPAVLAAFAVAVATCEMIAVMPGVSCATART